MSEIAKYDAQKKKLDGICEENNLVAIFRNDGYPITLTVKPLTGLDEQMTMLENVDEKGYTSPDASLVFTVQDGVLSYKTSETFTISKPLFSKIENTFKKMHDFWLQHFFRELMENEVLSKSQMPKIDNECIPEGAELLEDFEEEEDDLANDGELPGDDADEATEDESKALEDDEIRDAVRIVRAENAATTALLQRQMNVGYAKATQIMDRLEELGVVGPFNGSQPREVLPYDLPYDGSDDDMESAGEELA